MGVLTGYTISLMQLQRERGYVDDGLMSSICKETLHMYVLPCILAMDLQV